MTLQLKPLKTQKVMPADSDRVRAANAEAFETRDGVEQARGSETPKGTSRAEADTGADEAAARRPESVFDDRDRFSRAESRVALSAFGFIVFVLAAAWFSWDEQYSIVGDADTAYNYGLVGGLMMLVILVYAARKRLRSMKAVGDIRYWYYFHFILGVVGPVLIILHTSFDIRSINGGVALFAMLFVVFSGFIGRYIYARASYGLRGHERDLKEVQDHIAGGVLHIKLPAFKHVESRIKTFTDKAMQSPGGVDEVLKIVFTMKLQARAEYLRINRDVTRVMTNLARTEHWPAETLKSRLLEERKLINAHLMAAANIGRFQAFEKLASRWRILHVPLLYLLVLSGLAHVLAVHMY